MGERFKFDLFDGCVYFLMVLRAQLPKPIGVGLSAQSYEFKNGELAFRNFFCQDQTHFLCQLPTVNF